MKKIILRTIVICSIMCLFSGCANQPRLIDYGVNARINSVDPSGVYVKDAGGKNVLGDNRFVNCENTKIIEVNPETHEITEFSLTDLCEGDLITIDVYKDEVESKENVTAIQIQIIEHSK